MYRRQVHFDSEPEAVWELIGTPERYPEWWPRVIEVRGECHSAGGEFVQVTKNPLGRPETTNFVMETRVEMRQIRMSCQKTGMYSHWLLTPAQGGTFVELEMGMDPVDTGTRLFDATAGKIYWRRWGEQSLEGLRQALSRSAAI